MKPPVRLLIPLMLSVAIIASARELCREVDYVRFSEEGGVPVWDLSQTSFLDRSPVSFGTYGDSLYSETTDGWRRWFRMTTDSVLLIQEETLSELLVYTHPVPTAATGRGEMACEHPYETPGSDHSHIAISQRGTYLSRRPVHGRLVTCAGDTVVAVMTEEQIRYLRTMRNAAADTVPGEPTGERAVTERHRVSIRRWYCSGPLPVALSIRHEVTDEQGNGGYTIENTYSADFGDTDLTEEDIRKRTEEEAASVLSDMTVTVSGGVLCLSIPTAWPLHLTVDILSDSGIPYLHAERDVSGTEPVVLPCGTLPPGRHLVAVSTGGHTETRAFSLR